MVGKEFGVVTGRKRRCGWFDAVLVRQAVKTGGIDGIALTKLDVLDGLPELKICRTYKLGGKDIHHLPAAQNAQAAVEPIYETLPGWNESTHGKRAWGDLPAAQNAQAAVEPIYETLPGWNESTHGKRAWGDLPAQATAYIRRLEQMIEAPVILLSTSPEREDTILIKDPFGD